MGPLTTRRVTMARTKELRIRIFDPPPAWILTTRRPTSAPTKERSKSNGDSIKKTLAPTKERRRKSKGGCLQCGTTTTPQWRRGPEGRRTLCNACGVRYMLKSKT